MDSRDAIPFFGTGRVPKNGKKRRWPKNGVAVSDKKRQTAGPMTKNGKATSMKSSGYVFDLGGPHFASASGRKIADADVSQERPRQGGDHGTEDPE